MYATEICNITKKKQEEDNENNVKEDEKRNKKKEEKKKYRSGTNPEHLQEIANDVIQRIKLQRMKWLGHVWKARRNSGVRMEFRQKKKKNMATRSRAEFEDDQNEHLEEQTKTMKRNM